MVTEDDRSAHSPHGKAELCDPAIRLYEEALKTGRLARADVSAAPCLIDLSLVYADPWNDAWLRPIPPSVALAHLLQPVSREIEERLQLSATLSQSLLPLTAIAHGDPNMAITVLEGIATIQASIDEATATATEEILTAQPAATVFPRRCKRLWPTPTPPSGVAYGSGTSTNTRPGTAAPSAATSPRYRNSTFRCAPPSSPSSA